MPIEVYRVFQSICNFTSQFYVTEVPSMTYLWSLQDSIRTFSWLILYMIKVTATFISRISNKGRKWEKTQLWSGHKTVAMAQIWDIKMDWMFVYKSLIVHIDWNMINVSEESVCKKFSAHVNSCQSFTFLFVLKFSTNKIFWLPTWSYVIPSITKQISNKNNINLALRLW